MFIVEVSLNHNEQPTIFHTQRGLEECLIKKIILMKITTVSLTSS
jgi:hypothetical protein